MSIPLSQEDALVSHINAMIETELHKLPDVASSLIPGIAGMLVKAALSTDIVQAEAKKFIEMGADAAIHEAVKGLNELQASVVAFLHQHPALDAIYKDLRPTLTQGQFLTLAADEAKAIAAMKLTGNAAALRAFLGLA